MKKIKVYVAKADFNKSPYGNERECLFVEFNDCIHRPSGKKFKWMPTYDEIREILKGLHYIENTSWRQENDKTKRMDG